MQPEEAAALGGEERVAEERAERRRLRLSERRELAAPLEDEEGLGRRADAARVVGRAALPGRRLELDLAVDPVERLRLEDVAPSRGPSSGG